MSEPVCPACKTTGIDNTVSAPITEKARNGSAWFYVAHCAQCGYVYGVFAKHVFGRTGPQLVIDSKS
ncbi:MAG: transcriptional regulator [Pseudomonadota bacterium]